LSAAQRGIAAQSTSYRVFNTLGSFCNLGLCPGTLGFGCRRQWGEENNNATTVKMAGNGDLQHEEVPAAVSNCEARATVRHSGSEPASMYKFGEYVFLKDSRYAGQAKSACALPLGASARPGVIRMRIGLAAVAARPQ
jgi:hypothetical protein